jgi:hypothetical protein
VAQRPLPKDPEVRVVHQARIDKGMDMIRVLSDDREQLRLGPDNLRAVATIQTPGVNDEGVC